MGGHGSLGIGYAMHKEERGLRKKMGCVCWGGGGGGVKIISVRKRRGDG